MTSNVSFFCSSGRYGPPARGSVSDPYYNLLGHRHSHTDSKGTNTYFTRLVPKRPVSGFPTS